MEETYQDQIQTTRTLFPIPEPTADTEGQQHPAESILPIRRTKSKEIPGQLKFEFEEVSC